jgi:hypothetical protein
MKLLYAILYTLLAGLMIYACCIVSIFKVYIFKIYAIAFQRRNCAMLNSLLQWFSNCVSWNHVQWTSL